MCGPRGARRAGARAWGRPRRRGRSGTRGRGRRSPRCPRGRPRGVRRGAAGRRGGRRRGGGGGQQRGGSCVTFRGRLRNGRGGTSGRWLAGSRVALEGDYKTLGPEYKAPPPTLRSGSPSGCCGVHPFVQGRERRTGKDHCRKRCPSPAGGGRACVSRRRQLDVGSSELAQSFGRSKRECEPGSPREDQRCWPLPEAGA